MKRSELSVGQRYVAQIDGQRMIVCAIEKEAGLAFLCEQGNCIVKVKTNRSLLRPALDWEHSDSETVQILTCREQAELWDGEDIAVPALDIEPIHDVKSDDNPENTVIQQMYELALGLDEPQPAADQTSDSKINLVASVRSGATRLWRSSIAPPWRWLRNLWNQGNQNTHIKVA